MHLTYDRQTGKVEHVSKSTIPKPGQVLAKLAINFTEPAITLYLRQNDQHSLRSTAINFTPEGKMIITRVDDNQRAQMNPADEPAIFINTCWPQGLPDLVRAVNTILDHLVMEFTIDENPLATALAAACA